MKNRRSFLLSLTAGLVAAAIIVVPVIADELFGVITSVDVAGKKITVETKDDGKVVVSVPSDTEWVSPKGESDKVDLEKLGGFVKKRQEEGKKGVFAKVTHEKSVASKITVIAKKKAAPKKDDQ